MNPLPWNESVARATFRNYMQYQGDWDKRLRKILLGAANEADRLVMMLPSRTFSQRVRIGQFAQYGRAIRQLLDQTWTTILDDMTGAVLIASDIALEGNEEMISVLLRSGEARAATRLLTQFRVGVARAAENVQSRLLNDIKLSPRVYSNRQLSRGMVDRAINNGIALGKSAREIAKDVTGMIRPDTPGGISFAAKRLGRTEINNAFHTTQTRLYERQPWITGVQWRISGSHPRPDVCDEYANDDHDDLGSGVFAPRNVPGKPHPQCLCHTVAITINREEFLDNLVAGNYSRFVK